MDRRLDGLRQTYKRQTDRETDGWLHDRRLDGWTNRDGQTKERQIEEPTDDVRCIISPYNIRVFMYRPQICNNK